MGITGLIPFLEKASRKAHIKEFKGSTAAVDTYCWLHKGAFSCAEKLSRGEDTDAYIQYCMKHVNLLLSHNIKPILVFDGQHLPAKAQTETKRRKIREQSRKRAAELLRLGKVEESRKYLRQCVDITHEMALKLIQACRARNIDCIVAPYEADAQMSYLNKRGIAQYIITEDSDLVLFGCKNILFKFDLSGQCLLVESSKLHLSMGCRPEKYSFDKFRRMCILSGCDYLESLPGIGLAKACKFILKTEETEMPKALPKLPMYLNMRQLNVPEEYIDQFLKAEATFQHMFVFDPIKRKMLRLSEADEGEMEIDLERCSNAGKLLDEDVAFQLALGNLNPFGLKQLDNWNPDHVHTNKLGGKTSQWNQKAITKHRSIWQPDFKPHIAESKSRDIRTAFECKKFSFKKKAVEAMEDEDKNCNTESDIISLYSPMPKRKCLEINDNNEISDEENPKTDFLEELQKTPTRNKRNPFAKSTLISPTQETTSLLKIVSPVKRIQPNTNQTTTNGKNGLTKNITVLSRFFSANKTLLKEKQERTSASFEAESEETEISEEPPTVDIEEVEMEEKCEVESIRSEKSLSPEPETNQPKIGDLIKSENLSQKENIPERDKNQPSLTPSNSTDSGLSADLDTGQPTSEVDVTINSPKGGECDEIITLSDEESNPAKAKVEIKKKVPKKPSIRIGLSKPRSSKTKSTTIPATGTSTQSKLSMFGFQKRPPMK